MAKLGSKRKIRISKTKTGFKTEAAQSFITPKGRRFYAGTGSSRDLGISGKKATMEAIRRLITNPADSLTTQQFNQFKTK